MPPKTAVKPKYHFQIMCPVSKSDMQELTKDSLPVVNSGSHRFILNLPNSPLNSQQGYVNMLQVRFFLVSVLHECPETWFCLSEWAIKSSVAYFITVNMGVGALFQSAFWSAAATILAWVVVTLCRFRVQ